MPRIYITRVSYLAFLEALLHSLVDFLAYPCSGKICLQKLGGSLMLGWSENDVLLSEVVIAESCDFCFRCVGPASLISYRLSVRISRLRGRKVFGNLVALIQMLIV